MKLEVFNLMGNKILVRSDITLQSSNEFDLSSYPKGVYVIKITNGRNVGSGKVVVY